MKGELTQLSDTRWQYKAGLRTYYIKRREQVPEEGEDCYQFQITWNEKDGEQTARELTSLESLVAGIDSGVLVAFYSPRKTTTARPRKSACPGCRVNPCICVPAAYYVPPSGQQNPSPPTTPPVSGGQYPSPIGLPIPNFTKPSFNPNGIACHQCGSVRGGGCVYCVSLSGAPTCPGCSQENCRCVPLFPQQSSP